MAETIDFSSLTVPTPQPFDKHEPQQNLENLCYVLMQMIEILKSQNFTLSIENTVTNTINIDTSQLDQVIQALNDLKFNGYKIKIGPLQVSLHGQTALADIQEG